MSEEGIGYWKITAITKNEADEWEVQKEWVDGERE